MMRPTRVESGRLQQVAFTGEIGCSVSSGSALRIVDTMSCVGCCPKSLHHYFGIWKWANGLVIEVCESLLVRNLYVGCHFRPFTFTFTWASGVEPTSTSSIEDRCATRKWKGRRSSKRKSVGLVESFLCSLLYRKHQYIVPNR
jgi:hypothetical protein